MRERLLKKLRSRAGESISETLVALLIASLALVMLAGMISSTVSMVSRSEKTMAEYYANDILETGSGTETVTITIQDANTGLNETETAAAGRNTRISGTPVIAYRLSGGESGEPGSGD